LLIDVICKAGIPELEQRLIIYLNQYAVVRVKGGNSRRICIRKGVRQGCVISPILFNLYSEYMMKETVENMPGILINGQNINNLRYADDVAFITDEESKLQDILDKPQEVCSQYKMDINVKKTKVMVISKKGGEKCNVVISGGLLGQVADYKYLGSWTTEDRRCENEVKTRIAMAKEAFWHHKELMRGNLKISTKKRILECYVFSVLRYACESWTLNKILQKRVDAFEQWRYRQIMKISWTDKMRNEDVLKVVKEDRLQCRRIVKHKLSYAGHILRGSSGDSILLILECKIYGKKARGRPRRMWMDDIYEWSAKKTYGEVKRLAADIETWKKMILTHQPSD